MPTDTERLDWLEQSDATIAVLKVPQLLIRWAAKDNRTDWCELPYSLREAIDAAMREVSDGK